MPPHDTPPVDAGVELWMKSLYCQRVAWGKQHLVEATLARFLGTSVPSPCVWILCLEKVLEPGAWEIKLLLASGRRVMNRKLPEVNWLIKRHLRVSAGTGWTEEGRGRSPKCRAGGGGLAWEVAPGLQWAVRGQRPERGDRKRDGGGEERGCGSRVAVPGLWNCRFRRSPISGRSLRVCFPCREVCIISWKELLD